MQYLANDISPEVLKPLNVIRIDAIPLNISTLNTFDFKITFKTAILTKNWLKWLKNKENPIPRQRFIARSSQTPRFNQNQRILIAFFDIEHFGPQNHLQKAIFS